MQILANRQRAEQTPALRDLNDAGAHDRVRRQCASSLPAVRHAAGIDVNLAADRAEQRRLSGAVAADQRDDLARRRLRARRPTKPARRRSPRKDRSTTSAIRRLRAARDRSLGVSQNARRDRLRRRRDCSSPPPACLRRSSCPPPEPRRRREIDMIAFIRCSTTIKVTPRALTARNNVERFVDLGSVQAGHDLVEQEHLRIERERFRHLQAFAVGNRQIARQAGRRRGPGRRSRAVPRVRPKASCVLRFAPSLSVHCADRDVFANREIGERFDDLERPRDPEVANLVRRHVRDALPSNITRPLVGL